MKNSPTIQTKRFVLRRFEDKDLNDLHDILSDEEVNTYLPWFVSKTIEDTKVFLNKAIYAQYQRDVSYFYAIECKKTRQVIGYVDLSDIDLQEKCGDLGYGIRKDYWNQGVATEASLALLKQLKADGFRFVIATCDKHNRGSGRVMEKCGMTYQYSYEEQWLPKDILVVFRLYQINLDGKSHSFLKYWNMFEKHYVEKF